MGTGTGKSVAVLAAQEAVEGDVQIVGGGPGGGDGHRQNGVGAQIGLVLCAVCLDHGLVDGVDVQGVLAAEGAVDDGVHIVHSLGNTLAAKAGLVTVAQLQSLELAGGSARGRGAGAHGAVIQVDVGLNGGIAPGINDLTSDHFFNFGGIHTDLSFSVAVAAPEGTAFFN